LSGPPRWRLALRGIAEVVSALESVRRGLVGLRRYPSRADIAAVHTRLTQLDWQVARLFWRDGYRSDHPVRVLFAGELVATMWVGT
jgi:hypothetical protein